MDSGKFMKHVGNYKLENKFIELVDGSVLLVSFLPKDGAVLVAQSIAFVDGKMKPGKLVDVPYVSVVNIIQKPENIVDDGHGSAIYVNLPMVPMPVVDAKYAAVVVMGGVETSSPIAGDYADVSELLDSVVNYYGAENVFVVVDFLDSPEPAVSPAKFLRLVAGFAA